MTTRKLIGLYDRRFTALSKIAGLIAIVIFGMLAIFGQQAEDLASDDTATELFVK